MDNNAKPELITNDNNRTPILDGSVMPPRRSTRHTRVPQEALDDPMWSVLKGSDYLGLTDEEMWRQLDYDAKIVHHRVNKIPTWRQPLTDDEWDDHILLREKHMAALEDQLATRKKNRNETHVNYELGPREFTFTYSPTWFDDNEAREMMKRGIERLLRYYQSEIVEFHARGEVGKNGLSHIHCYYELKGGLKMTDKNFKRAYPRWNPKKKFGKGFEGGHHATVKVTSDFKGYIEKQSSNWFTHDIEKADITNVQEVSVQVLSQEARK